MSGPFSGLGWGVHGLILTVFAVAWIVLLGGIVVLLYLVIRLAVTHGILRADVLRERRSATRPGAPTPVAPPAPAQDAAAAGMAAPPAPQHPGPGTPPAPQHPGPGTPPDAGEQRADRPDSGRTD